ncbi:MULTISPECIES: uL15m family ribosomal protein [unclassified Archaeoglobus]|jgi:large subunit ribosomal protein L15|uniref:uL15m family ribosomal protein n=1 Tax=unclassified Archaeoglobus TaxID=2643606 RepID=UPI0025BA5088|nr:MULTISPECIES: uL15 family ribosomal protein [unclassified Archaeoglobus]
MPKKKVKKFRGSRTFGWGSHKNRRGRGNRGGAGNAGVHKHKYIKFVKLAKKGEYLFGKHGFTRPKILRKDYLNAQVVKDTLRWLKEEGKLDKYTYRYLSSRTELNAGDLDEIVEKLAELGIAEKEGEIFKVDLTELGYSKLLGNGRVTKKIEVRVFEATPKAVEKIEAAGGKVVVE